MDSTSLSAVFIVTLVLNYVFALSGKGAAAFQMPPKVRLDKVLEYIQNQEKIAKQ